MPYFEILFKSLLAEPFGELVKWGAKKLFGDKNPVVYTDPLEAAASTWMRELHLAFRASKWDALWAARSDERLDTLARPDWERAQNWIAVAAWNLGLLDDAESRLRELLPACELEAVRVLVLGNLAGLRIVRRDFDDARRYVADALRMDRSSKLALHNRLVIASLEGNRFACGSFARELLLWHPDVASPNSQLRTDPDLAYFRRTRYYKALSRDARELRTDRAGMLAFRVGASTLSLLLSCCGVLSMVGVLGQLQTVAQMLVAVACGG